jgi:putative multicomponent Na+:H+ antiporter subunit B
MLEIGVIILMGVFAWLAIHSSLLRLSIMYLAIFSLLGAFLFVLYAAPELAIAEAVIGSGLVTILYLTALQRYRVYTICVVNEDPERDVRDREIHQFDGSQVLREIQDFCLRREFEPQVIFYSGSLSDALTNPVFDLVIRYESKDVTVYGSEENNMTLAVEMLFQMHSVESRIRFERYTPESLQ